MWSPSSPSQGGPVTWKIESQAPKEEEKKRRKARPVIFPRPTWLVIPMLMGISIKSGGVLDSLVPKPEKREKRIFGFGYPNLPILPDRYCLARRHIGISSPTCKIFGTLGLAGKTMDPDLGFSESIPRSYCGYGSGWLGWQIHGSGKFGFSRSSPKVCIWRWVSPSLGPVDPDLGFSQFSPKMCNSEPGSGLGPWIRISDFPELPQNCAWRNGSLAGTRGSGSRCF